jgi:hypothetical protein
MASKLLQDIYTAPQIDFKPLVHHTKYTEWLLDICKAPQIDSRTFRTSAKHI